MAIKDPTEEGQAQKFKMIPPEGDLERKAFPHTL